MPPKKSAAKTNGVAKKPRAPKGGHVLAAPLPDGELLTDNHKKQWRIGKPAGSGGFGLLYLGSEGGKKDDQYVVKVEPHANGPLFCELHFYMRVAKPDLISKWMTAHKLKSLGVPKYIASGAHERNGTKYRFMVMERFGTDLQKLFEDNGKRFPLKTVLQLAIRITDALQYIHDNEYVHADIKASNLLLGYTASTASQVFLVDYGLAFRYSADGRHKEYKEDPRRAHDGTIEFTSTDAHKGVVPARRGDLEILGYCLLQWLCGKLPWEDRLADKDYVAAQKFKFAKDTPGLMRACFPKGDGPDVLRDYMKYVMNIDYEEEPDYDYVRQIFKAALKKNGFTDDGKLAFAAAAARTPKASGTRKTKKPPSSSEEDFSSPEPAKGKGRRPASPKKRMASPARTPKKRLTSPVGTPKVRKVPHPPVGIRSPPRTPRTPKSPLTPAAQAVIAKKLKKEATKKAQTTKKGRIGKIKDTSSVGTQTSPGLKGLRRSRKT